MPDAIVALDRVRKVYGSGESALAVLKGVDLVVERGEMVGIVGASGSGKTTLMNLLGCLDRPTSGTFRLDGRDVSSIGDDELSRVRNGSIGFVFQSFNLIQQLSVLENVDLPQFYRRVPKRERRARCLELLDAVGLSHRLGHLPNQLSGGECQRVAVARALVNDPALLLADEPTGNLDSKNGEEVLELFHELHRAGRTIVMVTHNPEIAACLPRIVEMKDGCVLSDTRREAVATGS
jgi:putative ABC transport system ATP-binding protein